jgi:hypothetical protein
MVALISDFRSLRSAAAALRLFWGSRRTLSTIRSSRLAEIQSNRPHPDVALPARRKGEPVALEVAGIDHQSLVINPRVVQARTTAADQPASLETFSPRDPSFQPSMPPISCQRSRLVLD